ncbi:MAG: universal stress protein [Myxococcota bacterium]
MRLVAAVDVSGGEGGAAVVEQAVPWAQRLRGTLDLAYASEWSTEGLPAPIAPTDQLDALWVDWQLRADAERRQLVALQKSVPEAVRGAERFVTGRPVDALPDVAEAYDLLVVSTHARRGLERVLLGSVTQRLLRQMRTPVLVVGLGDPPVPADKALKVVAPLDEGDDGALGWIVKHLLGCRVEIVHVLPPDRWLPAALLGDSSQPSDPAGRKAAVEADLRLRAEKHGLPGCDVRLVHRDSSNPGDAVAEAAEAHGADLIVMPTHTRSALEQWFIGSVAERVVERAPCPVLVVPRGTPR